jgi:hypothetical protein
MTGANLGKPVAVTLLLLRRLRNMSFFRYDLMISDGGCAKKT